MILCMYTSSERESQVFIWISSNVIFCIDYIKVSKASLPASEIFCILSSVVFASFMPRATDESWYLTKLRSLVLASWTMTSFLKKEVFNILYLCMSFLSRSSYPFVFLLYINIVTSVITKAPHYPVDSKYPSVISCMCDLCWQSNTVCRLSVEV